MGDTAELVMEGHLCQECMAAIDEDDWINALKNACGYPRYCWDCGGDPECNGAAKRKTWRPGGRPASSRRARCS